jgi:hypothetical protein
VACAAPGTGTDDGKCLRCLTKDGLLLNQTGFGTGTDDGKCLRCLTKAGLLLNQTGLALMK